MWIYYRIIEITCVDNGVQGLCAIDVIKLPKWDPQPHLYNILFIYTLYLGRSLKHELYPGVHAGEYVRKNTLAFN